MRRLLSGAQLVAARVRVCGKRLETFKSAAQQRCFGLLSKCGLEGTVEVVWSFV